MKVALYMRCGNAGQIAEEAIQMQETVLAQFAQTSGYEVTAKYHDMDVGWNLERRGLGSLLSDAADGQFERVIATGYDRLAIGTWPLLELTDRLNEMGVSVAAIHDLPMPVEEISHLHKVLRREAYNEKR